MKSHLLKSIVFLTILFVMGQKTFSQLMKFYDFPPSATSFSRTSSLSSTSLADSWSIAGMTNSGPGSYTKWLFQKLSTSGTTSLVTLLGEPMAPGVGSQNCWSHTLLTSPTDYNVLAGLYNGLLIDDDELFGDGAFTIIDGAGSPVITKKVALAPPFTVSTWRQVIATSDPGFTMTGSQIFNPTPSMYIPKVIAANYSSSGSIVWGYRYILGSSALPDELGHSICLAGDASGNYYVTGQIFLGGPPPKPYVFVIKLSPSGIPIWANVYLVPTTPSVYCNSYKIIGLPDGDVVVAGSSTANDPAHTKDIWLMRIHSTGLLDWSKTYGLPGLDEEAMSVIYKSYDASLVYTGYISGTTDGHSKLAIGKVDAVTGTPIWLKYYENPEGIDRGLDIKDFTPDNRVTGFIHLPGSPAGAYQSMFCKTDDLGSSGGCFVASSLPMMTLDVFVQQLPYQYVPLTDSVIVPIVSHILPGESTCGVTGISSNENESPKSYSLSQNYPNPFNPSTVIKYSITKTEAVKLTVYDITGKLVSTLEDGIKNAGTYEIKFDGNSLASGTYFYKIETNGFTDVKKMILVK